MSNRSQIVAIITTSMLLSACGGGADSSTASTTAIPTTQGGALASTTVVSTDPATPQSNVPVAATTLGDCFTVTPGAKFQMSDGRIWQIVDDTFQGRPAIASVELRADGTRFGAQFSAVDAAFIHFLGSIDYTQSGVLSSVTTYPASSQFPSTMQPGESFQFSGTNTQVYVPVPPQTTSQTRTEQETDALTYLGQENLLLGGHTFANVCKLKVKLSTVDASMPSNNSDLFSNIWFAKGFGRIQSEDLDAQGLPVPGSREQLTKIITAAK